MRAVILAGGRGSRLAPFTSVVPKPLLPVGDTPILEIIIRQLAHAGFDHITLTLGYMSTYFHAFVAQHRSLSRLAKIDFVEEEKPTGTAGSLASVPGLRGTFLVMNGDILTTLDYGALVDFHREQDAALTIAMHSQRVHVDLGVIETDAGFVSGFVEKPTLKYHVSMGIYVYEARALRHLPEGACQFPDLVLRLMEAGERVAAYENDAEWYDIGTPMEYERAAAAFERSPEKFGAEPEQQPEEITPISLNAA
jgi:NDP-mannose synthase